MPTETTQRYAREALEAVYGPFGDLTEEEATAGTPPDKPWSWRPSWTNSFGAVDLFTLYNDLVIQLA